MSDEISVDKPIGGEVSTVGALERTTYDEQAGEFTDVTDAQVRTGDHSLNEIGMVVDLLNKFSAETIRKRVIEQDS